MKQTKQKKEEINKQKQLFLDSLQQNDILMGDIAFTKLSELLTEKQLMKFLEKIGDDQNARANKKLH